MSIKTNFYVLFTFNFCILCSSTISEHATVFYCKFEEKLIEMSVFFGTLKLIYDVYLVVGLELEDLGLDLLASLLLGELALLVLEGLLLVLLDVLLGLDHLGVLTDLLVSVGVDVLNGISLNIVVNVRLEDLLVSLLVIVLELLHVLGNVASDNVLSENLSVELLGLNVETRESLGRVRDVQTTVRSTLHDSEHLSTSGGSGETNVKEHLERSGTVLNGLGELELSRLLVVTSVSVSQAELGEHTSGNQQTDSVSSGPVGETVLDSVTGQLVGVSGSHDNISSDLGVDNLGNDVLVGESHNQSVLGGVVLGLVLGDQTLTSVVVGLTLTTTSVRGLESRVVSGSLLDSKEHHCCR